MIGSVLILKISIANAFLIQLISVSGIRDYLQLHSNKFFYKLLSCDFCLSFWISVISVIIAVIYTNNYSLLLAPIIMTPITKKLL